MIGARPVNLGASGMTIGRGNLTLPPELQQKMRRQQMTPTQATAQAAPPSLAAALGRSEGAAQTPTVESGSIAEALAAALEGGLHGRAAYHGQQRQEQGEANEIARALAGDKREQQHWQSEEDYRARALKQDQTQFYERLAQDESQFGRNMEFQRSIPRGGGGAGVSAPPALRAGDQRFLDRVTEQSDGAQNLGGLISRFAGLNSQQPTGTGTDLIPGSWFGESRSRREEMEGLTAQMITQVRAMSGEGGIMTDGDAQRFERGLPSVHRSRQTNDNFAAAAREIARNAEDRANFLERSSASGSLQGTRADWTAYTRANPIYDPYGNIRTDRPGYEEWFADGQRDMSQELAPNSAIRGVDTDTLRENYENLRGANQPRRG